MKDNMKFLKIFLSLKFAIFLLFVIAGFSAIGSIIEQDETKSFYEQAYSSSKPLYGFLDFKFIFFFGLDHLYSTWWFLCLLIFLGISLASCTIARQFPLVQNSKQFFFKNQKNSFEQLPFFIKYPVFYYNKENFLRRLHFLEFSIYQKKNFLYGYKGLIGRISPIFVHFSLLLILFASTFSAFENFKSQEILPKGDVFKIQNILKIGPLTNLPNLSVRVNDFWINYKQQNISQFYSNLSLIDSHGNEIKEQSISVNNPLKYKNIDFYQSDWNLIGIRVEKLSDNLKKNLLEYPFFSLSKKEEKKEKLWITWIETKQGNYSLIFENLDNSFLIYNEKGELINKNTINNLIENSFIIREILPGTGLLIKYDPSILFLYGGFGLLIITTLVSYLPYTQLWIASYNIELKKKPNFLWIACTTNRGKFQIELEFENLVRTIEKGLKKKYVFFYK
jgi:cytochrome c biogenesis protein